MAWIERYKQKKNLFPKFQLIPILHFQVKHDYVCFIAPIDYCVTEVSCTRLSVKIALISYWNGFSLIPFGEVCFLEESYKNMQKFTFSGGPDEICLNLNFRSNFP